MGQQESKLIDSVDTQKIRQIESNGGASAVYTYFKERLDQWEKETVNLAITGRSACGKSSFINAIRNIKPGDAHFAKTGSGDTTLERKSYPHPKNKNIFFWDLPGMGTMKVPAATYADNMRFEEYDFFFIFFPDVINENDAKIATELIKRNKQFCFIRSKLDIDLESCKHDGVTKEEKMLEIKQKAENRIQEDDDIGRLSNIFYISSRDRKIGDMDLMTEYINKQLPEVKREAFVNTLASVSKRIIDEKYQQLKGRIKGVTLLTASISAVPVPGIDLAINIGILVNEIKHYIQVFGLSIEELGLIYTEDKIKLHCTSFLVPVDKLPAVISQIFGRAALTGSVMMVESMADMLLPFVGSLISASTTAVLVYRFLSFHLDNFYKDAVAVYKHIQEQ